MDMHFLKNLEHMISRINWRFRSVNEKSEKVLEQYDIGIRRMTRGRGGIILSTDKGYKLLSSVKRRTNIMRGRTG